MGSSSSSPTPPRLDWLDPLKALALLAILLNHLVEEFGPGPWFTNPSDSWPDLATRLGTVFPSDSNPAVFLLRFLGWLGDSGPGVFILLSGFGLAWASAHRPEPSMRSFYARRLGRVLPLYVALHFVILAGSLAIPGDELTLASPKTLLSLLGLRFHDSLFFYINPSWWFVWVILQLYLLFPLLLWAMRRVGAGWFLAGAIAATFLARGLALSDVRAGSLYYWMTGMFCGTRLAEFAAGMVLASLLSRPVPRLRSWMESGWACFGGALVIYLLGFGSSLFWIGSIPSNLLVTLGLTGLFYAVWRHILGRSRLLGRALTWMGGVSYGVFLLHQVPLQWTKQFFGGGAHLLAAVSVLLLSFPAAWAIERGVEVLRGWRRSLPASTVLRAALTLLSLLALSLLVLEAYFAAGDARRALALVLGLCWISLVAFEHGLLAREIWPERLVRWVALASIPIALFVLYPGEGRAALLAATPCAVLATAAFGRAPSRFKAWAAALLVAAVVAAGLEIALRRFSPLEAGTWGELPALEVHPTRVYGLKPGRTTRLRYNNYDYLVRANSMGLPGPEISASPPGPDMFRILVLGDAFTMPEGLPYEAAYPALLERRLAPRLAPRRVEVVNAGVTGYGPAEQLPQIRELAPLFHPNLVVYQFFINEFEEASLTREARLQSIGLAKQGSGLGRLLASSQLRAHLAQWGRTIEEWVTGRPGAWRYNKSLLAFYRAGPNPLYALESVDRVRDLVAEMARVVRSIGARMLIAFVPGAVAVSDPGQISYFPWDQDLSDGSRYDLGRPWRELHRIATGLGVPALDLTSALRNATPQPVYFPESWHWNDRGHSVAADAIADGLERLGLLPR